MTGKQFKTFERCLKRYGLRHITVSGFVIMEGHWSKIEFETSEIERLPEALLDKRVRHLVDEAKFEITEREQVEQTCR